MFLTTSKLARKNNEPCDQDDIDTVIPALSGRDAYMAKLQEYQAQGKVIYRSGSIVDGEVETVTLFQSEAEHNAFKAEGAVVAFEAEIVKVYVQTGIVTDTV